MKALHDFTTAPQAPVSPQDDPWDPITSLRAFGRHRLTSVEMTVSNLCNMRCEHCAVGDTLVLREPQKMPLDLMLRRLEEVEHLQTISITGGEPSFADKTVREYIIPLLKYARSRGVRSQINSNVTLDYSRYEAIAPYLDVMHVSFNYTTAADFHEIGFAKSNHPVAFETAEKMYNRMVDNIERLAKGGLYVSAESMINYRTHTKIVDIHKLIVEMGCLRHEVHPMYPSAFAANLPVLSNGDMRQAIVDLLDGRDKSIWMLFGTLPFYHCSDEARDRALLTRLANEPMVTVRNDPDGRNRLNVNLFTGDVFVTDFADVPSFGNVENDRLEDLFERWLGNSLAKSVSCHCPAAACCGPNLLVKDMYYKEIDFTKRQAVI
ncbi:radical SAM/CxCxxxxC motif protein YfkAB [Paenibacillus phyllosphaerae]|uniref:Radical SAM/CxCxxxxC motif protein YfkAB n=1 Tax=Paenibacillus phyllosphaerae TaxID=274593 RepID=A0A7W5AUB1_9BACL|nr:radical SAM/CxCxxxxC motif protein YfkAB [Paenibacillus phyllosphaerae]MBB3108291.1 radical SAM/CxCxxxxC motif protein YfkAB [Paenibacillus phyllosphaerae]